MRVLALTCALSLAGAGVATADEPSRFVFEAAAQAFPITATSGDWTAPPAQIQVSLTGNAVTVRATNQTQTYVVELERHDGNPITPGTHTDQKVLVVNRNLGCRDTTADFTVDRLDLDGQGAVTAFDASVVHRCGNRQVNELRATIHFAAR
ncbi:hypothetical protein [Lentzea sp. NPDC059081]|uniref:hypothetical protein n=1 Tax=Lentzea sp. NPDC059081 TaxID=3346719 RepID=UPI00368C019F